MFTINGGISSRNLSTSEKIKAGNCCELLELTGGGDVCDISFRNTQRELDSKNKQFPLAEFLWHCQEAARLL